MKQLLSQALNLMRQNPFHTVISIVGTAVTIAFVMVVVMIYDFRTADMAPESDRTHMMYTGSGKTFRKLDHTNSNSGMGRKSFESLFLDLPGVKNVTWYHGVSKTPCSLPASNETFNYFVRPVAANWFDFYDYEFIAGRSFTQEEYDARRWVSVITEHMAQQLFGTTDVIGKEYMSNFFPTKVVEVVKDVNAIFQTAYADSFVPFSLENEDVYSTISEGLGGIRLGRLQLEPGASPDDIRAEVQRRQDRLNSSTVEYAFEMDELYTHTEYTFFRGKNVSGVLVYGMLLMVLLIVPAINISGMMHAQIQERITEIAVRKAYGASRLSVMSRLFSERLLTTFFGGILGYIVACLCVWIGRVWLFGTGDVEFSGINIGGGLLLRPGLFVLVFGICIVFNLLSVLLPAWIATRGNIATTIKGE
ncbi:MAG: ABC transporter permease [Bacteroides sp.]|nr:ABC transporter permease [Bacteroides sp.]